MQFRLLDSGRCCPARTRRLSRPNHGIPGASASTEDPTSDPIQKYARIVDSWVLQLGLASRRGLSAKTRAFRPDDRVGWIRCHYGALDRGVSRHRSANTTIHTAGAPMTLGIRAQLKASFSFSSCSCVRLLAMSSKCGAPLKASTTLSAVTAPSNRKRPDVPSVTLVRTCLMKSSSMP